MRKTSATDSRLPPGADNSCGGPTRMPRGGEVSEYLFETGLCLPSGTQMTDEDLERIVNVLRRCYKLAGFEDHCSNGMEYSQARGD